MDKSEVIDAFRSDNSPIIFSLELPSDIDKLRETLNLIDSKKSRLIEINGLYSFDLDKEILYNEYFDEVKLTKR